MTKELIEKAKQELIDETVETIEKTIMERLKEYHREIIATEHLLKTLKEKMEKYSFNAAGLMEELKEGNIDLEKLEKFQKDSHKLISTDLIPSPSSTMSLRKWHAKKWYEIEED